MTEQELAQIGDQLIKAEDILKGLIRHEDDLRKTAMVGYPKWADAVRRLAVAKVTSLTDVAKKSALELGSTFTDGRFRVNISQPKRLQIDVKGLLEQFPDAKLIANLLSVQVDKDRFLKAVECGEIPEEVANAVSRDVNYGKPRARLTVKSA